MLGFVNVEQENISMENQSFIHEEELLLSPSVYIYPVVNSTCSERAKV